MVLREREAYIEEELYHLIRTILKKHNYEISGVRFGDIKPQYSVDGGVADLVLPLSDGRLFLVIECKRKVTKPVGLKTVRDFDPLGLNVVNQALNYAVRLGSNAFATTNGERLALFRTPSGEPFRFDTHRLTVIDPFRLDEKMLRKYSSF